MTEVKNPVMIGGGGGTIVNGIIEEYLAGSEDISANTFVQFVSSELGSGTMLPLTSEPFSGSSTSVTAVALDTNRVMLVYQYSSSSSSNTNSPLAAVVCTILDGAITVGVPVVLSSGATVDIFTAVKLSSDKVFVVHTLGTGGSYSVRHLNGLVCSVSGEDIIVGDSVEIASDTVSALSIVSAVLLQEGRVFVVYENSNQYVRGGVCAIADTSVSVAVPFVALMDRLSYISYQLSATRVDANRVLVAYRNGTSSSSLALKATMAYVSDVGITHSSEVAMYGSTSAYAQGIATTLLANGNVFIAYGYKGSSSSAFLHGVVVTISGDLISFGTSVQLSTTAYSGAAVSVQAISADEVLIAHGVGDTSSSSLYGARVSVTGDATITLLSDTLLSPTSYVAAENVSLTELSSTKMFAAANYSNVAASRVYGLAIPLEKTIRIATNGIDGITKTSATTENPGKVWVLNGGGVVDYKSAEYIVYNCAFRAERRA